MASKSPISRWSVLALIAAMIGGAGTLAFDQWRMFCWVQSGTALPVSERTGVELSAGTHVIYYQSRVSVPVVGHAMLFAYDPDGKASIVGPANEDESYYIALSGWSGRALWQIDVPEPGMYDLKCTNTSYPSDDAVPASDRIVIEKAPASMVEVREAAQRIRLSGAFLTIVLVCGLYVQHIRVARRLAANSDEN